MIRAFVLGGIANHRTSRRLSGYLREQGARVDWWCATDNGNVKVSLPSAADCAVALRDLCGHTELAALKVQTKARGVPLFVTGRKRSLWPEHLAGVAGLAPKAAVKSPTMDHRVAVAGVIAEEDHRAAPPASGAEHVPPSQEPPMKKHGGQTRPITDDEKLRIIELVEQHGLGVTALMREMHRDQGKLRRVLVELGLLDKAKANGRKLQGRKGSHGSGAASAPVPVPDKPAPAPTPTPAPSAFASWLAAGLTAGYVKIRAGQIVIDEGR